MFPTLRRPPRHEVGAEESLELALLGKMPLVTLLGRGAGWGKGSGYQTWFLQKAPLPHTAWLIWADSCGIHSWNHPI